MPSSDGVHDPLFVRAPMRTVANETAGQTGHRRETLRGLAGRGVDPASGNSGEHVLPAILGILGRARRS